MAEANKAFKLGENLLATDLLVYGPASELAQQRLQRCDDPFVRNAIACDDAVSILHFKVVVAQRLAKQVSQTSACLMQNNFIVAR